MIYGGSPFSYGSKSAPQDPAKYDVGQKVKTLSGPACVKARKHNGAGWEYGLEIIGLTKNALIWFTEGSLSWA